MLICVHIQGKWNGDGKAHHPRIEIVSYVLCASHHYLITWSFLTSAASDMHHHSSSPRGWKLYAPVTEAGGVLSKLA